MADAPGDGDTTAGRDTTRSRTGLLRADDAGVAAAAAALIAGDLVAFPTETVYGLGADARSSAAVRSVYKVKERPRTDPLIVHVADISHAEALGDLDVAGGRARQLAEAFWPGPLTVVVPGRGGIADEVAVGGTVGLRCPAHPVALSLLRVAAIPIAAPSANRFGRVSPTDASHVLEELGGLIPWVLDAGPTPLGVESTVVGIEASGVRVLRPGGVTPEDLAAVLGVEVELFEERARLGTDQEAPAPGMMLQHYSPSVPLILTDGGADVARDLASALRHRGLVATVLDLPAGDRGARELYARLRALDREDLQAAVSSTVEPSGLGRAVNDRLFRAARGRLVPDARPANVDRVVAMLRSLAEGSDG